MKKIYLSFCGEFFVPENIDELEAKFPPKQGMHEVWNYQTESWENELYYSDDRQNLYYNPIDGEDSITVYLAVIDEKTGHLIVDCSAAGWSETSFIVLENGEPKRPESNFNPNPVRQLV